MNGQMIVAPYFYPLGLFYPGEDGAIVQTTNAEILVCDEASDKYACSKKSAPF